MKELSKSDKLKEFIAPKVTYLTTFSDNYVKSGNIDGIYRYLEIIGATMALANPGQLYHHFDPSYSINTDTATLQQFISALRTIHKIICECYGRIVHKADACIIRGPKLISPSLNRNMNKFNFLHGEEPTDPPRQWNIQHTPANFKYITSTTKTIPVVSSFMGRINHNAIDNGDIEVLPSGFPVESNSESVTYTETTPTKSIDDDEIYDPL